MTQDEYSANIDAIQVATNHDNLPRLTRQEMEFVAVFAATGDKRVSAERCGITINKATKWLEKPELQVHIDQIVQAHIAHLPKQVSYSIEDAHVDIEMGKKMAANATEWFKGVEMLMRLHGIGEFNKKGDTNVQINIQNVESRNQLEALNDDQLLEMAGASLADILPQAIEVEAELVEES